MLYNQLALVVRAAATSGRAINMDVLAASSPQMAVWPVVLLGLVLVILGRRVRHACSPDLWRFSHGQVARR
jgi:hypothetical protein